MLDITMEKIQLILSVIGGAVMAALGDATRCLWFWYGLWLWTTYQVWCLR